MIHYPIIKYENEQIWKTSIWVEILKTYFIISFEIVEWIHMWILIDFYFWHSKRVFLPLHQVYHHHHWNDNDDPVHRVIDVTFEYYKEDFWLKTNMMMNTENTRYPGGHTSGYELSYHCVDTLVKMTQKWHNIFTTTMKKSSHTKVEYYFW